METFEISNDRTLKTEEVQFEIVNGSKTCPFLKPECLRTGVFFYF